MSLIEIWFLALALSVDAFVVSFSYGLIINKNRNLTSVKIAISTALGQFFMPIFGWYGASSIYKQIEAVDHWIAFFVFLVLGLNVIKEALSGCDCKNRLDSKLSLKILFMIGVATSIDAFVSGSMLYFVKTPIWFSASLIGFTTFICSLIGFNICRILKNLSTKWLEIVAGVILISLGCKILIEHLSI